MSESYTSIVDSLETVGIEGRHVKRRIASISALDAFAARRLADALEALILEAETSALEGMTEWPRSRGLEILPEPLVAGPGGRTRLCLQLVDEKYRQVFRALSSDICGMLESASDATTAVRAFHGRLRQWQSFLQRHGAEGLSEEARCGLFGELLILQNLLLPRFAARAVVLAWRGCKKAHQDFQFLARALEVKTTRATIPDRIAISNVQQLDDENIRDMFLTVVHIKENEVVGETLPEIVDRVRTSNSDSAYELLEQGLEEVGYSDLHRDLYLRTRYQLLQVFHFEVREGFPRLTRADIPQGVKDVRYELSFDACRPFAIDEEFLLKRLSLEREEG